jgi:hypothetical protein
MNRVMDKQIEMSPRIQHQIESMRVFAKFAEFDPNKRLTNKEDQYCWIGLCQPGGVLIIRETDEGWWVESPEIKKPSQLQKLIDDPTVACGWSNTRRFNEPGGWFDPS